MFLTLGIWFASCKTSRNIGMQKQVDYRGEFQFLRNAVESLRTDVSKQTKITTDKLSDLKIENTTVYFSSPDSIGKQYPIKESTFEMWNAYIDKDIVTKVKEIAAQYEKRVFKARDTRMKLEELITSLGYLDYRMNQPHTEIINVLNISCLYPIYL